jgi:putative NIF3 family GTP cyclohydrolase 1 type 2
MLTAEKILQYLISNSPWVDPQNTVDTVWFGDGKRQVHKGGVCWMPSIENLRSAHRAGCDLLITHEPLFWEHLPTGRHWYDKQPGVTKRKFLEETGIVVARAHDTWDNWPEIGIRDSWARGLGLTNRIRDGSSWRWHGLYEIPEQTLADFAQYIADRVRPLGEDSVQVIGWPETKVSRPSLGVGCGCPDAEMVSLGSDVLLVCYDGAPYWSTRQRLAEMGVAIITVEHGTSEMWGIESLCRHLSETFPEIKFEYFAEHPRTWTTKGR